MAFRGRQEQDHSGFSCPEGILVPLVFAVFVALRALDRAFLRRALASMGDYQDTLMDVVWLPFVQLTTFILCVLYVVNRRYSEDDDRYGLRWFSLWSPLASSQGPVPIHWVVLFAFWDQLGYTIASYPAQFLPTMLQAAMVDTVVFWTALVAFALFGSRFTQLHVGAVVLTLLAAVIGITVELQTGTLKPPVDAEDPSAMSDGTITLMSSVYLLGVAQVGVSNCYRQRVLKKADMDLMWATFWSQNFQILWACLMFTAKWFPLPQLGGGPNPHSPSTLSREITDAWTCFAGGDPTNSTRLHPCEAELPWVWFVMYLIFGVGYKLFTLWLIKYLSATWAALATVLCEGCNGVIGQFSFFNPHQASQVMPLERWLALICNFVAMWLYSVEEEMLASGEFVCGVPISHLPSQSTKADDTCDRRVDSQAGRFAERSPSLC